MLKGCDASILISTNPGSKELAEKDAEDNKDLRVEAFQTISKAKDLVERKCPGIVSCADILAIAARDYVHLVCSSSSSSFNIVLIMSYHFCFMFLNIFLHTKCISMFKLEFPCSMLKLQAAMMLLHSLRRSKDSLRQVQFMVSPSTLLRGTKSPSRALTRYWNSNMFLS
uniref:peroxidase n=1 Tax=Populus davidiana TaxID=266767 RepID=A0A6M2EFP6_9ROSI